MFSLPTSATASMFIRCSLLNLCTRWNKEYMGNIYGCGLRKPTLLHMNLLLLIGSEFFVGFLASSAELVPSYINLPSVAGVHHFSNGVSGISGISAEQFNDMFRVGKPTKHYSYTFNPFSQYLPPSFLALKRMTMRTRLSSQPYGSLLVFSSWQCFASTPKSRCRCWTSTSSNLEGSHLSVCFYPL